LPLQHAASGKFSLATLHRGEVSKLMQNNLESELLVTTDWLAAHLDDPEMRVVDTCKGDGCAAAHIPRAVRYPASIAPFLKEQGRVPSADRFAALMSETGIGDASLVIAYDDGNNLFARGCGERSIITGIVR
jgi:3-mercaptopyruvate sulfurtransferase SseA